MQVKRRKNNLGKFVIGLVSVCFSALLLALLFKYGLADMVDGESYNRTAYFEMIENTKDRY